MGKPKITIRKIAESAGVGVGTVSRVLNGHPYVNEDTRARILKVMAEHDYVPNDDARSLKRRDSEFIGVMVVNYSEMINSLCVPQIASELEDRGWVTVLKYVPQLTAEALVSFVRQKKLRALICLGGFIAGDDFANLPEVGIPLVFMSTQKSAEPAVESAVFLNIDNRAAGFQVGRHLLDAGHRKVAFIGSRHPHIGASAERFAGLKQAFEAAGLPEDAVELIPGDRTLESGHAAVSRLLARGCAFTAFFAHSDMLALGILRALHEHGVAVPEDMSVVGFDGLDMGMYAVPSLSTVVQPIEEMASLAVDTVIGKIEKTNDKAGDILLPAQFVERESSRKS